MEGKKEKRGGKGEWEKMGKGRAAWRSRLETGGKHGRKEGKKRRKRIMGEDGEGASCLVKPT
ncbi:MAG: hypothetical protein GX442_20925 [Candidatus Riflebacteria bacterium]|nr:hypothetical protein [Candidatus Riflebacteria bacterium]